MCKKCWFFVIVLIIILSGFTYKFIFQGSVKMSNDSRLAIQLEPQEKDLVLFEMRAFLVAIQQITNGIIKQDMQAIAESARKVGLTTQRNVPGSLIGKLPIAFKKMGMDTHMKFDALALDAIDLGDSEHTLSQLNILMQNCVACHAGYKFELTK
ncbi:hypothetical protein QUF74_12925 [Candidatus Halobeggiatoa sp. HSG11]|nr:hypothetical protein [Candidatus Halobeggiatoa sp. HSG11]